MPYTLPQQDETTTPFSSAVANRGASSPVHNATGKPSPLRHELCQTDVSGSGGTRWSPGNFQTPPHLQYLYHQVTPPLSLSQTTNTLNSGEGHLATQAYYCCLTSIVENDLPAILYWSPLSLQLTDKSDTSADHHSMWVHYIHSVSSLAVENDLPPRPHRSTSPPSPPLSRWPTGHDSSARQRQTEEVVDLQISYDELSFLEPQPRHSGNYVRVGLWNRRGDHLSKDGFTVYCPPGRHYPHELAYYPDVGFMDHQGTRVKLKPDRPEHPDSLPVNGRPAKTPYEYVCPLR